MPDDESAITIEAIKIGINYQVPGLTRLMTVFRGSKMFRALSKTLPHFGSIALALPSFHFAMEINSRFLTNPEEMFLQLCSKIHVSSVCFFRCDLWFQKWAHKDNFLLPWKNASLFRSPQLQKNKQWKSLSSNSDSNQYCTSFSALNFKSSWERCWSCVNRSEALEERCWRIQ